jgi:hypothetical protein
MRLLTMADSTAMETGFSAMISYGALAVALAVGLVVVVLVIAAVFSILFSRLDLLMKFVWIVLVCVAPLIGALLWFLIGRNRVPAREFHGYR